MTEITLIKNFEFKTQLYVINDKSVDNYMWYLVGLNSNNYLIDAPFYPYLETTDLPEPTHCLLTHEHHDHVEGIPRLREKYPNLTFVSDFHTKGNHQPITALTDFTTIKCKTHSKHSIIYYSKACNLLFTGDTIFLYGVGRFFNGTAEQLHDCLDKVLRITDDNTIVCVGHDYVTRLGPWASKVTKTSAPNCVVDTMANQKVRNPYLKAMVDTDFCASFDLGSKAEVLAFIRNMPI